MGQTNAKLNHLSGSHIEITGHDGDRDTLQLTTVPRALEYYAETRPDRDAVVFLSSTGPRVAVSWLDLYTRSCSMARALTGLGVKQGEVVAVNMRNCPEWLYAVFGTMLAGAVPIGMAFTFTDGRDIIATMKSLERCSTMILEPGINGENWNIFKELLEAHYNDGRANSTKMPFLRHLIMHGRPKGETEVKLMHELFSEDDHKITLPKLSSSDTAYLFQTSGSTGIPKVVAHTHGSIMAFRHAVAGSIFHSEDIVYHDRPFNWVGGFPLGVTIGQTRVTVTDFPTDLKEKLAFVIDIIAKEKCTSALFLPSFVSVLTDAKDMLPEDWPLKTLFTGGQPIKRHLLKDTATICKTVCVLYGASECLFPNAYVVPDVQQYVDNKCGPALHGEIKVVDDQGKIVPLNTIGEVCVRCPCVFRGYWNAPEKTAVVRTEDGWYRMDDLGFITDDGLLSVIGRKSDTILCGGMTVAPDMLEAAIQSHPGVKSVAAVPVPDEIMYQVVCACVLPEPGHSLSVESLRAFCQDIYNDKTHSFTVLPKYYMILEHFPETSTGKTSKKILQEMAQRKFAPGSVPTM